MMPEWEIEFYWTLIVVWVGLAAVVWLALRFIVAPYGRHVRSGWGPTLNPRIGWIVMEAPASIGFFIWFLVGPHHGSATAWVFLLLWQVHYIHRAFIYPYRMRGGKRIPIVIVAMGAVFNLINAYINARWLFALSGGYSAAWLTTAPFWLGTGIFLVGFSINRWADRVLRRLRAPGETEYKVPRAGLYRWVSSPNYLGEIVEWMGWAVATWSVPGAVFAWWTYANLAPRARANHRWYHHTFANYPQQRRALWPFPKHA